MDVLEDAHQVPPSTEIPDDLQTKLVSIDGKHVTNGTSFEREEALDIAEILDDWMHFRNLPSVKSIFVGLVTVLHWVLHFFLDYMLKEVVMTLAMVEAPDVVVPAPWTDKKDDDEQAPRVQMSHERSVTVSLSKTIRHLYHVGGVLALCRGLALHVCAGIAQVALTMPGVLIFTKSQGFPNGSKSSVAEDLMEAVASTSCAMAGSLVIGSMLTAWTHIVITQPTLRIWYRRLPPFLPTLRATWLPVVLSGLSSILGHSLPPILLKHAFGLDGKSSTSSTFSSHYILLALIWLSVRVLHQLTCFPIGVAITRIQASLLPEEEETIVSVDRSFGTSGSSGLRPGILAEPRGALGFSDAWRSITWSEMRRLWILSAKILAVEICVNGMFWLVGGKGAWPAHWDPRNITNIEE